MLFHHGNVPTLTTAVAMAISIAATYAVLFRFSPVFTNLKGSLAGKKFKSNVDATAAIEAYCTDLDTTY